MALGRWTNGRARRRTPVPSAAPSRLADAAQSVRRVLTRTLRKGWTIARNISHAPTSMPALIDTYRELLIELRFIVGPVEPDLSALDVVQSQ